MVGQARVSPVYGYREVLVMFELHAPIGTTNQCFGSKCQRSIKFTKYLCGPIKFNAFMYRDAVCILSYHNSELKNEG